MGRLIIAAVQQAVFRLRRPAQAAHPIRVLLVAVNFQGVNAAVVHSLQMQRGVRGGQLVSNSSNAAPSPSQAASQRQPTAVFQPPTTSPAPPSTHAGRPNDGASPVPHEQVVGIIHAVAAGRHDQLAFGARRKESPLHNICSFRVCESCQPRMPMALTAPAGTRLQPHLTVPSPMPFSPFSSSSSSRKLRGTAEAQGAMEGWAGAIERRCHVGAGLKAAASWAGRSSGALAASNNGWHHGIGTCCSMKQACWLLQPSTGVGLGRRLRAPLAAGKGTAPFGDRALLAASLIQPGQCPAGPAAQQGPGRQPRRPRPPMLARTAPVPAAR